ncbi:hypothetical protein GCM10022198_11580 [Klugiella xanthotipulae]|uniref:Acetyl esterase/lipase n=1 Tax=Klugiella xanthotipulae TaxID=244735 RepID=A0A543HZ10_9MICO|nr:alpha/beta hydrolase [Klugiella xanthotipulae]TQM63548.1 acetyl esterase/lipase [Klugiella xanthotipulae]
MLTAHYRSVRARVVGRTTSNRRGGGRDHDAYNTDAGVALMPPARPRPWYRRPRRVIVAAVAVAATSGLAATLITPTPSVLIVRELRERGAAEAVAEMAAYAPGTGVAERLNIPYDGVNDAVTLDLYTPEEAGGPLPVVVWVHGGTWASGSKADVAPYLRILAAYGYATVSVDYSLAPEARYPDAVTQVNNALGYVSAHATELGIDPDRMVLAGDSAGAQLASQVAALTTNPGYAADLGIVPTVAAYQLRGIILDGGVYDLDALGDLEGAEGWGFATGLWAYTGTREWAQSPVGRQMSTIHAVTAGFPETFIAGGNADALTRQQSRPFAQKLADLGVPVTAVFFSDEEDPGLAHGFPFQLDLAAAHTTLARTVAFLVRVTA